MCTKSTEKYIIKLM